MLCTSDCTRIVYYKCTRYGLRRSLRSTRAARSSGAAAPAAHFILAGTKSMIGTTGLSSLPDTISPISRNCRRKYRVFCASCSIRRRPAPHTHTQCTVAHPVRERYSASDRLTILVYKFTYALRIIPFMENATLRATGGDWEPEGMVIISSIILIRVYCTHDQYRAYDIRSERETTMQFPLLRVLYEYACRVWVRYEYVDIRKVLYY